MATSRGRPHGDAKRAAIALARVEDLERCLARYQRPAAEARRYYAEVRNAALHRLIVEKGLPARTKADWVYLRDMVERQADSLCVLRFPHLEAKYDPLRPLRVRMKPKSLRRSYRRWCNQNRTAAAAKAA